MEEGLFRTLLDFESQLVKTVYMNKQKILCPFNFCSLFGTCAGTFVMRRQWPPDKKCQGSSARSILVIKL